MQLVSGSLPTLSTVEEQHGPDAANISAKVEDYPKGLGFARAGLRTRPGPNGPTTEWTTCCPLCGQNNKDDQGHFVACNATQEVWGREVRKAARRAAEGARCAKKLRTANKIDAVVQALVTHLMTPGAPPTRRCGLGNEAHLLDAYKKAFGVGELVLNPLDLLKNLRLELLSAASVAFETRKALFTGLHGSAIRQSSA